MAELIESIKKVLEINRLSDRQFALNIGIDPGNWTRIQQGKTKPSTDFFQKLVDRYPELKLAVSEYIGITNGN
jgi:transcriptional regulator with XRE-family HTH domain